MVYSKLKKNLLDIVQVIWDTEDKSLVEMQDQGDRPQIDRKEGEGEVDYNKIVNMVVIQNLKKIYQIQNR